MEHKHEMVNRGKEKKKEAKANQKGGGKTKRNSNAKERKSGW